MPELFIKALRSDSLTAFAEQLAVMSQSSPWEECDSVHYPDGRYFRQRFGSVEVVAQVADDFEYPAADFLLWIWNSKDSEGRMDIMADALTRHGYVLLPDPPRPKSI